MDFTERLKTLRKQANLTQKEMAEIIGISQPAYGDWERGVKKPSHENLIKIAKFYGVTTDYLLEGKNDNDDVDSSTVDAVFRMASDGLTEYEKSLFRKDIIDYINERKKLFEEDR